MNSKHLFLITLIALSPVTAYTGVYKWTDQDGKTHYSQTRPSSDIQYENLRIHGRAPQSTEPDDPKGKAGDAKTEKKPDTKDKKPAKKENKALSKESKAACQAARKNLAQMQASGRIRQKDAKGNISYLSEKQKQEAMKKEQKIIANNCK
ncbi:MAG: DUF4124 domain-containing protein [Gammaproteobacteria bacterium]|nr:DUF4124 domain-containing protein [Gammaproteobacteria bacterium]